MGVINNDKPQERRRQGEDAVDDEEGCSDGELSWEESARKET